MSAALTRAISKRRPCATRNGDKPIAGWLIALVIALVFAFGVATDAYRAIASIL